MSQRTNLRALIAHMRADLTTMEMCLAELERDNLERGHEVELYTPTVIHRGGLQSTPPAHFPGDIGEEIEAKRERFRAWFDTIYKEKGGNVNRAGFADEWSEKSEFTSKQILSFLNEMKDDGLIEITNKKYRKKENMVL